MQLLIETENGWKVRPVRGGSITLALKKLVVDPFKNKHYSVRGVTRIVLLISPKRDKRLLAPFLPPKYETWNDAMNALCHAVVGPFWSEREYPTPTALEVGLGRCCSGGYESCAEDRYGSGPKGFSKIRKGSLVCFAIMGFPRQ